MSSILTDRSPVGISRGNYLTILNLGWDYDKILFTLENKKLCLCTDYSQNQR